MVFIIRRLWSPDFSTLTQSAPASPSLGLTQTQQIDITDVNEDGLNDILVLGSADNEVKMPLWYFEQSNNSNFLKYFALYDRSGCFFPVPIVYTPSTKLAAPFTLCFQRWISPI